MVGDGQNFITDFENLVSRPVFHRLKDFTRKIILPNFKMVEQIGKKFVITFSTAHFNIF